MRHLIALAVLAAALAAPTSAPAGGWATVDLEAVPAGIDAGETWTARFVVLRHAVTPTDGAKPSVSIVDPESKEKTRFAAAPTGETGEYEAAVVFPTPGTWRFEIDNGLAATGMGESATTRYQPVTIGDGGGAGVPGDGGVSRPFAALGLVLAVGLALAVAFGVRHRRRLAPAGR